MHDMLVKLYDLPETVPGVDELEAQGIVIKRALPPNKSRIVEYVRTNFGEPWANECEVCFSNKPVSCFIAVQDGNIVGFACYEATALNFFGPTGVAKEHRGKGIGAALLMKCLLAMREMGYAYAIIGWVSEADGFYRRTVGAEPIPNSLPGVYCRMIGVETLVRRLRTGDNT